ncbi:MAG TPA: alpha/beta fold hydrolase [Anaerolineales bacterium]
MKAASAHDSTPQDLRRRQCRRPPILWALLGLTLALGGCAPAMAPLTVVTPGQTSALPTPATSPTPTASPTPSLTPTPTPHPLTLDWLRSQSFTAGPITIEQTLEPGANYFRYLASYPSEGLKIYALLTVPYAQTPANGYPAIVFNHGFIPPDSYRTTERYIAYVDAFARHGYVVFRPDYRGHGDSEGLARGAYSNPDYTVDVLNAFGAVQRDPLVDPNRVGLWGHSMGGYITLRAMVVNPDIRAGVIWAGVVASYPDLLTNWRRSSSTLGPASTPRAGSWRGLLMATYGSPEDNPSFWNSISANAYLADLSGPLQLHHGTGDSSVPFLFSRNLAVEIREIGGEVELYEYDGDDHNLSQSFSLAMQRSINFFDAHLKLGEE